MRAKAHAFAKIISACLGIGVGAPASVAGEAAAAKPLPAATEAALQSKQVADTSSIYIRIFKEESELEIWKARATGRYVPVQTFPICNWSGTLGPKKAIGDHMSPEGFYGLTRDSLKPDSKYHLALNVGYPNALDRALGRTGDFIMVHGNCVSVGCFAMTDGLIEQVYAFTRDAFDGGQERIPLHIFPFRMSGENMLRHAGNPAVASWAPLKEAYDDFARSKEPPRIAMCSKRYVVNPASDISGGPADACPDPVGKRLAPISPRTAKKLKAAGAPLVAEGPKTRTRDDIANWNEEAAKADMQTIAKRDESRRDRKQSDAQRAADMGGVTPYLSLLP